MPGTGQAGRYFTYNEHGPAEGVPFTITRHRGVLASRADLAAQIAPAGGAGAEAIARAVADVAADPGRESRLAVVAGMIARYRAGGHLAGHEETARLLAALRHLRVRDDAWARMDPVHKPRTCGYGPT